MSFMHYPSGGRHGHHDGPGVAVIPRRRLHQALLLFLPQLAAGFAYAADPALIHPFHQGSEKVINLPQGVHGPVLLHVMPESGEREAGRVFHARLHRPLILRGRGPCRQHSGTVVAGHGGKLLINLAAEAVGLFNRPPEVIHGKDGRYAPEIPETRRHAVQHGAYALAFDGPYGDIARCRQHRHEKGGALSLIRAAVFNGHAGEVKLGGCARLVDHAVGRGYVLLHVGAPQLKAVAK